MTNVNEFFDKQKNSQKSRFSYIQQIDIIDRLESAVINKSDVVSKSILLAIKNNLNAALIISNVTEMANDNRKSIEAVIGYELTEKLLS